ncbi:hypothetical protein D8S78_03190 [Natrialba swarupiae]|nr:hypothetical protein [Natrialba swarupiae]
MFRNRLIGRSPHGLETALRKTSASLMKAAGLEYVGNRRIGLYRRVRRLDVGAFDFLSVIHTDNRPCHTVTMGAYRLRPSNLRDGRRVT